MSSHRPTVTHGSRTVHQLVAHQIQTRCACLLPRFSHREMARLKAGLFCLWLIHTAKWFIHTDTRHNSNTARHNTTTLPRFSHREMARLPASCWSGLWLIHTAKWFIHTDTRHNSNTARHNTITLPRFSHREMARLPASCWSGLWLIHTAKWFIHTDTRHKSNTARHNTITVITPDCHVMLCRVHWMIANNSFSVNTEKCKLLHVSGKQNTQNTMWYYTNIQNKCLNKIHNECH